jgi:hypothetical protein
MDILIVSNQRFVVRWHEQNNGWFILSFPSQNLSEPLLKDRAIAMKRLCNYFELDQSLS